MLLTYTRALIRFSKCGELSQMMGLVTEKACLQDLGPRDIQIYTKPQRPELQRRVHNMKIYIYELCYFTT